MAQLIVSILVIAIIALLVVSFLLYKAKINVKDLTIENNQLKEEPKNLREAALLKENKITSLEEIINEKNKEISSLKNQMKTNSAIDEVPPETYLSLVNKGLDYIKASSVQDKFVTYLKEKMEDLQFRTKRTTLPEEQININEYKLLIDMTEHHVITTINSK